ncbi:MAG: KGGVGR-motif variant AAA ATPase [Synechocystis sp.]
MKVITFYSYKGGVGRTLAASNFAVYLAKLGLKTVVIDFDLEAPGIDAKFGLPELSCNQKGLLDYILVFQQTNQAMESLQDILIPVPFDNTEKNTLWLIPAGQYLSENYYRQLNQLDWSIIFSEDRDGVSFFQQFLARIKSELNADFVIIDSRTGITESAGLCTQQLADEVVMLSSLSSESIRVTKHIKELIQNSQISKALGKNIDIKVVVSRVPKPDDLFGFKEKCCQTFEAGDDKLFFLFSCPALELNEFLAINEPEVNEELVNNYVKLFYALDLELAEDKIIAEIENVTRRILRLSPKEAEQSIIKLATIYPHIEAYRAAMYFFRLKDDLKNSGHFAEKIFNILPDDNESQTILAKDYLRKGQFMYDNKDFVKKAINIIDAVNQKNQLTHKEIYDYAKFLMATKNYKQALKVILNLADNDRVIDYVRRDSYLIASKCAHELQYFTLANECESKANSIEIDDF